MEKSLVPSPFFPRMRLHHQVRGACDSSNQGEVTCKRKTMVQRTGKPTIPVQADARTPRRGRRRSCAVITLCAGSCRCCSRPAGTTKPQRRRRPLPDAADVGRAPLSHAKGHPVWSGDCSSPSRAMPIKTEATRTAGCRRPAGRNGWADTPLSTSDLPTRSCGTLPAGRADPSRSPSLHLPRLSLGGQATSAESPPLRVGATSPLRKSRGGS